MPNYILDPSNSQISFYVSYLVIAKVKGDILSFKGNVESKLEDFTDSQIEFTGDTNSINTGISDRDEHLRSEDFLNCTEFPSIKFISTSVEKKKNNYIVKGVLRIKDVSKEVQFTGNYNLKESSFLMNTNISREEYNLKFNSTPKGNHLVGDEIKVFVNVSLTKKD